MAVAPVNSGRAGNGSIMSSDSDPREEGNAGELPGRPGAGRWADLHEQGGVVKPVHGLPALLYLQQCLRQPLQQERGGAEEQCGDCAGLAALASASPLKTGIFQYNFFETY